MAKLISIVLVLIGLAILGVTMTSPETPASLTHVLEAACFLFAGLFIWGFRK